MKRDTPHSAPLADEKVYSPGVATSRLLVGVIVLSSFAVRLIFADFESGDYKVWLTSWYNFFLEHGAWHGLAVLTDRVSNYPPLYMYFISLSTLLPLPPLYSLKLLSVTVDYMAAWYIWRLTRLLGATFRRLDDSRHLSFLADRRSERRRLDAV